MCCVWSASAVLSLLSLMILGCIPRDREISTPHITGRCLRQRIYKLPSLTLIYVSSYLTFPKMTTTTSLNEPFCTRWWNIRIHWKCLFLDIFGIICQLSKSILFTQPKKWVWEGIFGHYNLSQDKKKLWANMVENRKSNKEGIQPGKGGVGGGHCYTLFAHTTSFSSPLFNCLPHWCNISFC